MQMKNLVKKLFIFCKTNFESKVQQILISEVPVANVLLVIAFARNSSK